MKVKVSDFVAQFLVDQGIDHDFTVPGGGAMHLDMSLGHQKGMNVVYMQHEQAAAIAAEGYYRQSNRLPVVVCTTGPGGSNTLTGVLGSWLDSIPMLVISGQVKYLTTVRSTYYPMRSFGDQDYDITQVAQHMTKYAVMVTEKRMIKYHLKKAIYLATHGRPGPVWLDIPLNVQWDYLETDELVDFDPSEMLSSEPPVPTEIGLREVINKIKAAKRPVLYSGVELRTAGVYNEFHELANKLNIPVVTSYDGIDMMDEDDPLYAGRAGDMANRYGNWTVQNADLLLVIGSKLGIRQVSYATETWARKAFVIMVNPDSLELTKPNIHVEMPIRASYKVFLDKLNALIEEPFEPRKEWLDIVHDWKKRYPAVTEKQHAQKGIANAYAFLDTLSRMTPENTTVVSANGTCCVGGGSAFLINKGVRYILNAACASMGYGLPASIGACFASGRKETYCLTGDGSIQMNLQELQTLVHHKLPIKIFLINNEGYHSMRQTETNLFNGMSLSGVGPESGDLSFPNMSKIADAYGIPYCCIHTNDELKPVLSKFISSEGYGLCEVFVDKKQFFEPKPSAMKQKDGSLISPPLEDLAPFLPREELRDIMLIPLVGDDSEER